MWIRLQRSLRLVLCLSLWSLGSRAGTETQDVWNAVRPPIRAYGMQEGPPNMSVYVISEDRSGRLWIGTQDGTALYNGSTWTYLSLPSASPSQFVRGLAETRDGSRWFGTEGGGLWRLKAGQWTQYRAGAGFSSNTVNSLVEIQEEGDRWSLWACTAGGGVARFQEEIWTFMDSRMGLPSNYVWKIRPLINPDGTRTLWAATTRGFARFERGRWKAMTAAEGWPEGETNDIAQSIFPDGTRHLWLSLWGQGLRRWDGKNWEHFDPTHGGCPSSFPINLKMLSDPEGQPVLWVSTYDRGVVWFSKGIWRSIDSRRGLPSNGIYSLYAPPRGKPTLWLGMRGGGLVSLDLSGWYHLDREMGLPSNEIHAFVETKDPKGRHELWVGTSEGLAHWGPGVWKVDTTQSGLPHDHVASLLATDGPEGRELWAGTLKGLARRSGNRWRTLYETQGLQDKRILCLMESRSKGHSVVWAGTDKGLLRLENGKRDFLTVNDGLPASQVYALGHTKDSEGSDSVWVGTRGSGIGCLKNGVWTKFGEADGLINLSVFCFCEVQSRDGRRWLWAGTFGGGAVRLNLDDPGARKWEAFTLQNLQGLPSNVVVRIESDAQGRVYLATQRGMVRIKFEDAADPAKPSGVETFTYGDGVPPIATNYGASLLDHAGRLWVATNQGVAVLDPTLEKAPPPLPGLILDQVMLGGHPGELSPTGTVLPYQENQLTFEVSLPTFHREEEVRYRTQLVGLEDHPTPWTSQGRRELIALPSGSFTLHIEAKDHLGRQATPIDIPVKVRPAPWKSGWAYTLYIISLAAILAAMHHVRTRLLMARNLVLEQRVNAATAELQEKNQALLHLNEEKNQFMGIAAHDLKNPINGVMLAAQQIAAGDMDVEEAAHFGRMIERASRQMGELIKNMLDVNQMDTGHLQLDFHNIDLPALAEEVRQEFDQQGAIKGIRVVLEAQKNVSVWADPLHLKDVLENFVSNAIKFTQPGPPQRQVTIRVKTSGDRAVLEVSDQGPGFSDEDKAKVFGRFTRLSARPTSGEGSTGLGLSIVKRLVEAMNGRIDLESELGRGATFRVSLPQPEPTSHISES